LMDRLLNKKLYLIHHERMLMAVRSSKIYSDLLEMVFYVVVKWLQIVYQINPNYFLVLSVARCQTRDLAQTEVFM